MSVGRTVTDLSDAGNTRECIEEYRRARDGLGGRVVTWALKWGDAIAARLDDLPQDDEDLEKAHVEATNFEARAEKLKEAIETAVDALDDIPTSRDMLDKIISTLERAVSE